MTLGLFAIVINMVVLWVTTIFTDRIDIEGFWAYFWAALIVSIVTLVLRICPTAATTDRPCGAARLEPGRLEACRRATGSVSAKT